MAMPGGRYFVFRTLDWWVVSFGGRTISWSASKTRALRGALRLAKSNAARIPLPEIIVQGAKGELVPCWRIDAAGRTTRIQPAR